MNNIFKIIHCFVLLLCFSSFYFLLIDDEEDIVKDVDTIVPVSCNSDSMGLVIGCKDRLLTQTIEVGDNLRNGSIYIFKSPYQEGELATHRLVDFNETHALFKGDNNAIADPWIKREDILYKVLGVRYGDAYYG